MREITINLNDKDRAVLTDSRRITGETPNELAADAVKRYIKQYRKTGTRMTGKEFHGMLDESTKQLRRFNKRFEINRQIEKPNKKPALRIIK
jgi:hypothetical protein